jgi:hypothetical protein
MARLSADSAPPRGEAFNSSGADTVRPFSVRNLESMSKQPVCQVERNVRAKVKHDRRLYHCRQRAVRPTKMIPVIRDDNSFLRV